ncbi:N/A [soil metagenome]
MKNNLRKISILGISLTSASKGKVLEHFDHFVSQKAKKGYLVTPNPEMLVLAQTDKQFKDILNHAELSLVDGVGLVLASKLLGKSRLERFSGSDFVEDVCKRYVNKPVTVGFLGGRGLVAEMTAECLMKKYPGLSVGFISDEWRRQGFANARLLMKKYRSEDSSMGASRETPEKDEVDILFVAFGFPKQEYWIAEHLANLPITMAIGVGGAFDYISGTVPRAPRWAQAWGMEWLYRLIRQPWRGKRQLALFTFVGMVMREKLKVTSEK